MFLIHEAASLHFIKRRGWTPSVLHFLSLCREASNKAKVPVSCKKRKKRVKKGSATLSELPLGCRLRSFRSRCWPRSPPPNTTFTTYPVDTHHTLICNFHVFKCQPAVDYAACFAIKGASQKNLKHSEGKGSKVLFLKGIHYHNKEHTISLIKQACCRRATTTQQVMWAVWAEIEMTGILTGKEERGGIKTHPLLELHNVTVNDGWDVREKMPWKA